ncbi:hypothetical protein PIB30_096989 [Stylosanthes scabra]|uniref:Uncharacterized protein n=1 Tax=Stylosanthes scabra TaxID=79078 RepID=A0ABU6TVT7_9FABA|nr:hypothetical protein [Stylosanthes scabra]
MEAVDKCMLHIPSEEPESHMGEAGGSRTGEDVTPTKEDLTPDSVQAESHPPTSAETRKITIDLTTDDESEQHMALLVKKADSPPVTPSVGLKRTLSRGKNAYIPPPLRSKGRVTHQGLELVRPILPHGRSEEDMKSSGKMKKASRDKCSELNVVKQGETFPPFISSKMKIKVSMRYSLQAVQHAAYIFSDGMNPEEVLVRRGTKTLTKKNLFTLLSNNEPSDYIMEMMAYMTSWTQSQLPVKTVWSLPLQFSVGELILL